MTPLFPKKGQPITIKQGKTGDCFLLSSLDCIFNNETDGVGAVRTKFKQTEAGVTLRIKRTDESMKLHSEKMNGKYTCIYDPVTDEDVIFIDNKKLKEIDESKIGVSSNSLAVKILERISAYYYQVDWEGESIRAHNIHNKFHNNPAVTHRDTEFLGKLLGIYVTSFRDPDKLIKLKTINPNVPIFIGMDFGRIDEFGKRHGRHALRVEKILPLQQGDFEVTLINPWNNQKQSTYLLSDLRQRKCHFAVFDISRHKKTLTELLLLCKRAIGQYIINNNELASLLCTMKECGLLNQDVEKHPISSCIELYKKIPDLIANYESLPYSKRYNMLMCIAHSKGSVRLFNKLIRESSEIGVSDAVQPSGRRYHSVKKLFADKSELLTAPCELQRYNELLKTLKENYEQKHPLTMALENVEKRKGIYAKMDLKRINQRLERLIFFMHCHTSARGRYNSDYSINQQPLFWANSAEKLNALFHNQERELIPGLRRF